MAFINDYLNEKEINEFKKRAIPYPKETGSKNIVGYHPYAGKSPLTRLKCTLDRDEKIYLFHCGMERYDFETQPKKNYFVLIGDEILENAVYLRKALLKMLNVINFHRRNFRLI